VLGDAKAGFMQRVADFGESAAQAQLDLGFDLQSATLLYRTRQSQMRLECGHCVLQLSHGQILRR
jgi:hypothetical protein